MIVDISNEVYTNLKNTLVGVTVLTSYPSTTPVFPCVTFEELANTTNVGTVDTSGEKYNDVSFEINIFSNSTAKVTEIKNMRNQIDNIMSELYSMSRGYSGTTPNYIDSNVSKYTLRYNFTIDKNKRIYRR